MDKFTYGFVLTVVGMGGTLVSLWFLTVVINLLKRVFPYREADEKSEKEVV
jgi:Na+-transporting methylmalonyl-CoA/oxaloacetate decarboxylase gamma subunit